MFKLKGSSFGQIFGDRPGMIKNNSFKQLTKKTSFSTREPSSLQQLLAHNNSFCDSISNINSNYAISSYGVSRKSNSF